MSDISISFGPLELLGVALMFAAPGIVAGAVLGALLWRRHRVWGALAGAAVGWPLALLVWFG